MTSNGPATFTYDAESRLLTTAGVTYTYDGDGNRVKKSSGTLYWGASLAESDLAATASSWKDYIYFAGKRVARREAVDSKAHYYYSDHLGSSSVVTDEVGTMTPCTNSPTGYTTIPTGEEESDFYPYGGEMKLCDRKPQNYKFTGKERDTESGLDNFGARFDSSALGRFMTPDWAAKPTTVPYASFGDPQTLNLYAYVENSPINQADADGHAPWGYDTSWGPCGNSDFCQQNGKEAWKEASLENAANLQAQNEDESGLSDGSRAVASGCSVAGYICAGQWPRGGAARPDGTDNPFKKMVPDPNDPTKVIYKDKNGKTHRKNKPPGFDDYWKSKHPDKNQEPKKQSQEQQQKQEIDPYCRKIDCVPGNRMLGPLIPGANPFIPYSPFFAPDPVLVPIRWRARPDSKWRIVHVA